MAPTPDGRSYLLRDFVAGDAAPVLRIFNHYVGTSFASFPEQKAEPAFIDRVAENCRAFSFKVVEAGGAVAGFGLLRPLYPFDNMHVGEVSYFIEPGFTRAGIGTELLEVLSARAKELGMRTLVATISSRNRPSLAFHRKRGFGRCGRIKDAGEKFGKCFDVVTMQKAL